MFVLGCAVTAAPTLAGPASDAPGDETHAVGVWLEERIEACVEWTIPEGVRVSYSLIWPVEYTRAELREMQRRVEGKPDHPLREEIAKAEAAFEHGPTESRKVFWSGPGGRFRLNSTEVGGPLASVPQIAALGGFWVDMGGRADVAWSLTPVQIRIADGRGAAPSSDFASSRGQALNAVKSLRFEGLDWLAHIRREVEDVRVGAADGDGWAPFAATVRIRGDTLYEVRGAWSAGSTRGVVNGLECVDCGSNPEWIGSRRTIAERRTGTLIGDVASRIVTFKPDGSPRKTLRFDDAQRFDPSDLEALTRVPDPLGEDPVRGEIMATSVDDTRTGEVWAVERAEDGTEALRRTRGPMRAEGGRATLTYVGWGAASVVVALLIGLRIKSFRAR